MVKIGDMGVTVHLRLVAVRMGVTWLGDVVDVVVVVAVVVAVFMVVLNHLMAMRVLMR